MPDKENSNNNPSPLQNLTVKDVVSALTPFAKAVYNDPDVQAEINRIARTAYSKEMEEYNNQAINLTNKEIESLLWSIHSGKNTYKDLKEAVPRINSSTICLYLTDTPKAKFTNEGILFNINKVELLNANHAYYFQLVTIPDNFISPYEFQPTDSFILTITAKNMIYQIEKERYMKELAEKSLAVAEASLKQSEKSTRYGKYAAILALVGIIVTLYLSKS